MAKNRFVLLLRLTKLAGNLLPLLGLTSILGIAGYLSASFLLIFAAQALAAAFGEVNASIAVLLALTAVCAAARGVLRYFEQLSGHYVAFRILAMIRDKVFAAMRRLAPAKLEQRDKGDLIALITADIELLEVFYAHTLAPVVIAFFASLLMSFYIGAQHPLLGAIAVVAYLTIGVLHPLFVSRRGRERGWVFRSHYAKANAFLLESLSGLGETLRFGGGSGRKDAMNKITDVLEDEQMDLKGLEGRATAFADSLVLFFSGLLLLTGLWLFSAGTITFGQLLIAVVALMSSFGPVVAVSNLSHQLLHTLAAGERVLALLDEEPETGEVKVGLEPSFAGAICEDVGFSYQNDTVLQDVNLMIPVRGITGIFGASGSGKSTLLKLLMRFWDVDSGAVRISGVDIRQISTAGLRRIGGYVTQETFLFAGTLLDNIRLAKPDASLAEVEAAASKAGIHDFISALPRGYETELGELGEGLSAGECQRIGLARAFLHGAPLLLLDEPTCNLDGLHEAIFLRSLHESARDKSIVLVSHRTSTLKVADTVLRMEAGRVQAPE